MRISNVPFPDFHAFKVATCVCWGALDGGLGKQWRWVQFWQRTASTADRRMSGEFLSLEMEIDMGMPVSLLVTTELFLELNSGCLGVHGCLMVKLGSRCSE